MDARSTCGSRQVATGTVTLLVSADAAPGNNQFAGGYHGFFRTIQDAVDSVMWDWDLRGQRAKIQVADGTYTDPIKVRGVPLGGTSRPSIIIEGNVNNPGSCVLDIERGDALLNMGGYVAIAGFKFTTRQGTCIHGCDSGRTTIGRVEFGEASRDHVLATVGHIITHIADYEISGGASIHAHVTDGAVYGNGRTVKLSGVPHFKAEFHGINFARSRWAGAKFIGSASGRRHLVHYNAVCAIGGSDSETFFPGDRSGLVKNFSTMA